MPQKTRGWDRIGKPLSFTELGFGTAPMGNLYRAITDDEAHAMLERAWDAGVRYFDTAPLYGFGLSETRLNRFLRGKPREAYVLSTKVGRLLHPCPPDQSDGIGKWFEVPARNEEYNFTYDGVMRSLEFSLERLGLDRVDILFAHDLDVRNQGGQATLDSKLAELMDGGYRALSDMRDQGVISAFGAGVNEWEPVQWMAERGEFDLFLLAGRYTLLEQEALETCLPLLQSQGAGVVLGGPYNSGILATGARKGAYFDYDTAPDSVMSRVARIEAICAAHSVRLVDAAFQFPLMHPSVVSVIPGGQSLGEMESNIAAATAEIPAALWAELKAEGLMRPDAPVGGTSDAD